MLDWKLFALLTPLFFVSYQALSKLLPKDLSIFLVNAYASLIGVALMVLLHLLSAQNKSLQLPAKYLSIAIGIGVLISLGNFGIIKAYSLGAPQSLFTLFFYVALIIYGILFGLLIWSEKLNVIQVAGITLSLIGVFIAVKYKS